MSEQRGAKWLAHERIGAATEQPVEPGTGTSSRKGVIQPLLPPRYPLTDCMDDRALVAWWMVLQEFGVKLPG